MVDVPAFPAFPGFPGFPSPPSPPPPSGGTRGIPAVPFLDTPPPAATDTNGATNTVVEGAAVNTLVGISANSVDPDGQTVTYSIGADSSGGGFKIDPTTGVVSVADSSKINFETAPGHAYTITVNSSDGYISTAQNFTIAVTDVAPTTPVDSNSNTDVVLEGAAVNSTVGVTAASTDINGPGVTYSLTGDTSGGGFKIDPVTGVISVADSTKIDYESAPGHAYTVTAQASDGTLTNSQTFVIAVADVPLSTPVDNDLAANSVAEGAANGAAVGITASAFDPNGPAATYSLIGDSSLGGFTINAATGVVTIANSSQIDYETSGAGHSYTVTVQAQAGAQTTSHSFTIGVTNVAPTAPTDSVGAANTVVEGAATGTPVGLTAASLDPNGPAVTYSLTDDAGGRFAIDSVTGAVKVGPNANLIDFETSGGTSLVDGSYNITVQASDGAGGISSATFAIAVTDAAPTNWTDADGSANSVIEGAANGSATGVVARAFDPNGGNVTYAFAPGGDANGAFAIDPTTGAITVADGTKIDFESAAGHSYTLTVQGTDDSGQSTTGNFVVNVTDVAPPQPTGTGGSVAEGATAGSPVGITAHSDDVNGGAISYSLSNSAGGLFTIDATTGAVAVTAAGATGIDYESTAAAGHKYVITVDASDGTASSSQNFSIDVTNAAPSQPTDSDGVAGGSIALNAPDGTPVGITFASSDPNGGAVTYSLTGSTAPAGTFVIDPNTGVVTLAAGHPALTPATTYTITGVANDGLVDSAPQTFNIFVANNALNVDLDSDNSSATIGNNYAATYSEQAAALSVTDSDDVISNTGNPGVTTATSAKVVLTNAQAGDVLTVNGSAAASGSLIIGGETINFTKSVSAGSITVDLTGTASYAHYQTALHDIAFSNTSDAPNTTARIVNVTVTDSTGTSPAAVATIGVTPLNDPPVLTLGPAGAVTFTEKGAAAALFSTGSVVDPDAPANFNGGSFTVQITGNASAGDQIVLTGAGFSVSGSSILLGGTTIGSIHAGTGLGTSLVTIDLNASATSGVVNQLVDAFGFQNSSNNPATATRTVSFTFNDGGNTGGGALASNTVTQTVHVTAVNDAPVASNGTASGNEDTPISGTAVATDVDSPSLTYSLDTTVNANGGAQHGTVTFTNAATGAYTYTPDANYNGTDTFTFKANDGSLNSNNATITVTVNPVNDAPVLAANASIAPAFTEKGAATQLLSAGTVTDPDNPADFTGGGLTVAIQGPQAGDQIVVLASSGFSVADDGVGGHTLILNGHSIGSISFGTGSATVSGLTAFATPAVVNQLVEAFGYQNSLDNFDTTSRHVDLTFNDGGNTGGGALASNTLTQTITLTAVNDAPVNHVPATAQVVGVGANLVFSTINGNAISVTDDAAIGAVEKVTLTAGTGTLTLNGIAGLSFTTGDGTADTTMTFSGTLANINNALAGLSYTNATPGSDVITMTTDDNGNSGIGGALQDTDTVQIAVTTTPSANPAIDLNGTGAAGTGFENTFTEAGSAAAIVDPAVTIVDTGGADVTDVIASATITLVNHQANDVLVVNNGLLPAGVTASSYNAATGVLTLTGSGTSTAADFQTALQAISFSNPDTNPSTVDRTITITVNDGTTDSNTAIATVHVTAVNNAPALDLDAIAAGNDFATDYSANGAAVAIANASVSITDADNATLASATAVLTNAKAGDILSISGALPPGITAVTTTGPGTITVTLTGSATLADYQNALKQVGFSNSSDAPDQTARDIAVTVNDGAANSNTAHTTITMHPVNHPPVAQNGSASGNEDNDISGSVIASDVDGNTLTYSLVNANGGALHGSVVVDSTTGAYTYTPNQDFFGTDSFQFKANDGSLDSNAGTVTVSVSPVNDAPVLDLDSATSVGAGGDDFATAYTISGTAASVTGTALITDVDDTNIASATVTLTNAQSNDVLTINGALPGGIVATTDTSVVGVITVHLTGSATHAQYQAALHQIVFSNGLANPDQTSPDRVITVVVNDGEAANSTSNTATTTVHITQDTAPVANAKTASAIEAGGVNNGTPGSNGTGNVITDAVADSDAEDQTSALIVSAIAHGATPGTVGNLLAGDFGTLTINHDGSYTYLVDNANSTVQALRLSTDTLTDSFTYTIRDSAGLTSISTLVVTIHGADDAPVAVADTASATEAGGLNNGTPGVNPTGNVLSNDTDVDTGDSKAVQGVASGTQAGPLNTNVATDVNGSFGKINIANDGTYTYTVDNSNASVQALRTSAQTLTDTFSYTEKDTAGGTSTTQVTVTIHGQNDNPTAVADSATAVEAGGTNNGTAGSNATGNVLTNDTDPDTVANGETQTVQGVESGSHSADTVTTGAGSPITGAHGTLTLNTNGSFTYVVNNADTVVDALNIGQSTTDTFTYTMHDAASATSTGILTVTINGADDAPIAVNQGSAASPAYNAFDAVALNVAAAGVKTGASDVDNTFASLTAVKDTSPAHGTATVNSDGSFTYTATAGYFGNDSFNYHISDGTLSSNSATAFINVTPHVAYIDNTASAVGEDGSLAHPFASIADFNTANTIANHFDIIYVEKGTGTYTTSTGITLQAGQILEGQGVDPSYVRGDNGQTVVLHDFDNSAGNIATIQVTSGAAVTLNSGNTIQGLNITESGSGAGIIDNGSSVGTFTLSGVHITTGAGAGLSLTHGGTVTATTTVGTNSIASGAGTALNITNTTIGAGNVTFHDISANGAVNGIVLNNTGTSGHLAVTGTGTTAGSGGTIQNTSGDSISLTSTQDVNLADMNVTGSQGYGIIGHTVNGIVLSHDSVSGSGNSTLGDGEGNIYLYELTGSASHATTFDSVSVTNAYVHNVFIENTGGTLTDLQVTNSTFSNNGASTHAGDEFQIILSGAGLAGAPTATVHATHDTFSGNLSTPSTFTATGFAGSADDGTLNVHIGDGTAGGLNTFDTNDSGITINATNTGNINFDINDNTVNHNRAVGITANNQGSGVLTGFIRNNVVGQQGVQDSGAAIGDAIDIDDEGTGASHVTTLAITNNIVQSVGDTTAKLGFHGINVIKQSGAQNTSGVLNLTVTGNTIRDIWNDRGLLITDMNTAGNSSMNLDVENNTFSNADAQNGTGTAGNTTARIGGAPGGTDHVNVTQASAAALAAANGLSASNAPGNNMRVDSNVFFNHAAPALPPATPQLALNGQGPGSTDTLTMDQLAPLLLAAVQHWADAGASAAQIALLENTHIFINDLPNSGILANTDANGITIDNNGAGWGWFIDPTPGSNSEFGVATTPHDFMATGGDAANHIDLLTVIEHELGHVLGLDDSSQPGVMNVNLDTGERREPDSADVANALSSFQAVDPPAPPAPASTAPSTAAASTAGQAFDAGQGGHTFVATAGPDTFVFSNVAVHAPAPPPVTLVENYSFAQGDKFDFSAITSQFHGSSFSDGLIVRAVEDASGKFASLQVDTLNPHTVMPGMPNWVTVAQIDGAHAGDAVNVLIDGAAVHLTQLHVGLLA